MDENRHRHLHAEESTGTLTPCEREMVRTQSVKLVPAVWACLLIAYL